MTRLPDLMVGDVVEYSWWDEQPNNEPPVEEDTRVTIDAGDLRGFAYADFMVFLSTCISVRITRAGVVIWERGRE